LRSDFNGGACFAGAACHAEDVAFRRTQLTQNSAVRKLQSPTSGEKALSTNN
jgi:hypothetical protein